jgi:hypothetical protein
MVKVSPVGAPANIDATFTRRERPVFSCIGGKLVHCETDGLGGPRVKTQFRAVRSDPRPDKVCKVRELGARQILHIDPMPLVPNQQVLIGGKRLKAFSEAPD